MMLTKFSVENFKNFEGKFTLDLSHPCNYEFNTEAISEANHCVTKGIIYGPNGSGKSNLGLAIFDIITHVTDKEQKAYKYNLYLNLNSPKSLAEFSYEFVFDGVSVVYAYGKTNVQKLEYERLTIQGREVLRYDFHTQEGYTILKGTESLNIKGSSPISRIKYIRNNAILEEDETTRAFLNFTDYVDRMLLFYSLDERGYQGFQVGTDNLPESIIRSGHLKDFEKFLRREGLSYDLIARQVEDKMEIFCNFKKNSVNFFSLISTGTSSLTLFYYWYLKMKEASFVFIDEFDAFYHFETAKSVVEMLRDIMGTQIFLTTHNTDLMSNDLLRPDCYFLLNENSIVSIDQATDKELRKAHNLQKMYKAGAFL